MAVHEWGTFTLLDESTSSLDAENEFEIYQNIWQAFKGTSIIASIHKMNLLKRNERFKALWDEFIAQSL